MKDLLKYLDELEAENRGTSQSSIDYHAGRADMAKDVSNYVRNIRKGKLSVPEDKSQWDGEYYGEDC